MLLMTSSIGIVVTQFIACNQPVRRNSFVVNRSRTVPEVLPQGSSNREHGCLSDFHFNGEVIRNESEAKGVITCVLTEPFSAALASITLLATGL